jgi:hypothetical protein
MSDTNENTPANETSAENLQGNGGMMSFDAASGIAEAFEKLQIAPEPPASEPSAPAPAEPAPEKSYANDPVERTRVLEEASQKLRKPAELEGEPESSEELPKEAASLKKWAVNMKKDWKAERSRREELEAKVAELESGRSAEAPEEVQRLRAQNEEYERELQVARVEATQEFKDVVTVPMQQIRGAIDSFSSKYEIAQKEIYEALSDDDASARADKLSDLAAGMNDRDKYSLYELEKQYLAVEATREKVVSHAKLALQKIAEHREEEAKLQHGEAQKRYGAAFNQVWEITQQNLPMLRPIEGDQEWNAQIQDIVTTASNPNFEGLDDTERAKVAIRSAAAPLLVNQFLQLYGKYQELEKAMSKYQAVTPRAGGGTSPSAAPKEEFEGFLEAISAKLNT